MSARHVETCNCLSSPSLGECVEVMLDEHRYREKPPKGGPAWGAISWALARNRKALTLPELAELLTSGCTFAPGVFRDGKRSNDTWVQQQVFGLDFDHGWRVEDFLRLSERLGVRPAFVYPTFSHTATDHRFRAVFVNDAVVTDSRLRELIQGLLLLLFVKGSAKADIQCRDAARFFLGSNQSSLWESFNERINPIQLISTYLSDRKAADPFHFSDYRRQLAETFGLALETGNLGVFCSDFEPRHSLPAEVGENIVDTINIITSTSSSPETMAFATVTYNRAIYRIFWKQKGSNKPSKTTTPKALRSEEELPERHHRRLGDKEKQQLLSSCSLVSEFMAGSRHIGHQERRILVTNLRHLEGGAAWYREGLAARTDYGPDSLLEDARRYNMKPEGCANCSASGECNHRTNLLQQLPVRRRECRKVSPSPPSRPLHDTREKLREALARCMASPENKIFVIRCDAGAGKTEELLRQNLDGVCMAFDTHRLKQEAYDRLRAKGQCAFLWPEPPPLPSPLAEKLQRGFALGLGGSVAVYTLALTVPEVRSHASWAAAIERYLAALNTVHCQSRIATTHDKAYQLLQSQKIHTFIFDEDFTRTLIHIDQVRPADVDAFRRATKGSSNAQIKALDKHLKSVLHAPTRMTIPQSVQGFSEEAIHQILLGMPASFCSPIETLFRCEAFRKDAACPNSPESIYCITRQTLSASKKYIVLSATADEQVYRLLFGERLVFIDLSGTELKGKLFCHTRKSFSKQGIRSDLAAFAARVQKDKQKLGFEGVITHKLCAEKGEDGLYLKETNGTVPVFGTFGALQGLDSLGGKKLAVYGTPYPPIHVVKLWAFILGLAVDEDEYSHLDREVEWGEYQLNVPTCAADPDVQRLYLWLAHSEIVQAVGRARLVSHDTEVHVFAKLPISGCRLEK